MIPTPETSQVTLTMDEENNATTLETSQVTFTMDEENNHTYDNDNTEPVNQSNESTQVSTRPSLVNKRRNDGYEAGLSNFDIIIPHNTSETTDLETPPSSVLPQTFRLEGPSSLSSTEETSQVKRTRSNSFSEIFDEDKFDHSGSLSSTLTRFRLVAIGIPVFIGIYYVAAIFFPPEPRQSYPVFFWANGELISNEKKQPMICPYHSLCSEGLSQIILLSISRTTAFASYTLMGLSFLSHMDNLIYALSSSFLVNYIPFTLLHMEHKNLGRCFGILALIHTFAHLTRFILRADIVFVFTSQVGLSGVTAFLAVFLVGWSMSSRLYATKVKYETRLNVHHLFVVVVLAMIFHHRRCRIIFLFFSLSWLADWLYGMIFKTYRIDNIVCKTLPNNAGTQVTWENPEGFYARSGSYLKVQFPWLAYDKLEWHPFSTYIYCDNRMDEDFSETNRPSLKQRSSLLMSSKELYASLRTPMVHNEEEHPQVATNVGVLFIKFQNEFIHVNGKKYNDVKDSMKSTDMIRKTVNLAEIARSVGAHVFHIPLNLTHGTATTTGSVQSVDFGVMKEYYNSDLFTEGTWNAEFSDSHKPKPSDTVILGKTVPDSFFGTNLESELKKKNIDTLIIGGFLNNSSVLSTAMSAYSKSFRVVTLTDGTASSNEFMKQETSLWDMIKMFSQPMTCKEAKNTFFNTSLDSFQDEENGCSGEMDVQIRYYSSVLGDMIKDKLYYSMCNENRKKRAESTMKRVESRLTMMSLDTGANPWKNTKEQRKERTEIFIHPSGDWTKQVYDEAKFHHEKNSVSWIRGPYLSPYAIAYSFSRLVLVASGIGITPALSVMSEYSGSSRFKVLFWMVRCKAMLKFFLPLMHEAQLAIIFYTNKDPNERLTNEEIGFFAKNYGNVIIQHSRPCALCESLSTIITTSTAFLHASSCDSPVHDITLPKFKIEEMAKRRRKEWCVFYCGGSKKILNDLSTYSKNVGVEFKYEMFHV